MKFDMERIEPDGTVLVAKITNKISGGLRFDLGAPCDGCHFDVGPVCDGGCCVGSARDGQDIILVKK